MTRRAPQRIDLTIDRLVLRGFAPEQRDAIAAGLAAELRRQFSDPASARQFGASRSLASLRATPVTPASQATPQQIGARTARQLARSIQS